MKSKNVIILIMIGILAISTVGCGDSSSKEIENSTDAAVSDLIEDTAENQRKLSLEQLPGIKEVLDAHGVKTGYYADGTKDASVYFSKDDKDRYLSKSSLVKDREKEYVGLTSTTLKKVSPDPIATNKYVIDYSPMFFEDKSMYRYNIKLTIPNEQEIKLEDFPLLIDLLKEFWGEDFDVTAESALMNEHLTEEYDDTTMHMSGHNVGAYRVVYSGGNKQPADENRYFEYIITLRTGEEKTN